MEAAVAGRVTAYTVGWLADQTDTDLMLIQTAAINADDEDALFNRMDIPKGMILEMKVIEGFDVGEV
jgi:hypothetical protein